MNGQKTNEQGNVKWIIARGSRLITWQEDPSFKKSSGSF